MATAIVVHLAAWFALASLPDGGLAPQSGPANARAFAMEIVVVKPSGWTAGPAKAAQAEAAPATTPALQAANAPHTMPSQPDPAGPAASGAPSGGGLGPPGDDGLFQVPFRDATGQATAELRAGLSCAHVDTSQLPKPLRDQCAAR